MRKITLILAMILALLLAVGCSDGDVGLVELTDWQSYTVVRSDYASKVGISAASTFISEINDATGFKPKIATDFIKKGESVPIGTLEILIGTTNRPESPEGLRADDFTVKFENNRLIIAGGSGEATVAAVDWYLENCVKGGKLYYPSEGFKHVVAYPYADVKIDGVLLSDYNVKSTDFRDEAAELTETLLRKTGLEPSSEDHVLELVTDDSLNIFEARVRSSDGKIELAVGDNGMPISAAISLMIDAIDARSADELTLELHEEFAMDNVKYATDEMLAEWDKLFADRKAEIFATPNMEIPKGAKVCYISERGDDSNDGSSPEKAWKTLARLNNTKLEPGTYVLFERGSEFRGQIVAQTGVTYTAYGEGDKPIIKRSEFNAADPSLWEKTDASDVWVLDAGKNDVGLLVFDGGEEVGDKVVLLHGEAETTLNHPTREKFVDYHDLLRDLQFYHDNRDTGKLWLKSEQNPGERFESIELLMHGNVVRVGADTNDVTVDNLFICYGGSHGVGAGTVENLTVTNCRFEWIGGSRLSYGSPSDKHYDVRYGNAVEIYGGCDGFTVTDNYITNVYDTGITQQVGFDDDKVLDQRNILYARNLIENCNWSIEYFHSLPSATNASTIENFVIEDNIMRNAGTGFSQQRFNKGTSCHIMTWTDGYQNRAKDYYIRGNYMLGSIDILVRTYSSLINSDTSESMPFFENNQYLHSIGKDFGFSKQGDKNYCPYGANVPEYLGERSNGDIFWILNEN